MSARRLLVTGGSGYLGERIVRLALTRYETLPTYFSRPIPGGIHLDICDGSAVEQHFRAFRPQVVIHTAYEKSSASVIVDGSTNVARAAEACGARLIHLSTDVLFDGEKGMYREEDVPNPVIPYGRAKYAAERAVLSASPTALVVRTSLIYGLGGDDVQSRTILDGIALGIAVTLFTDEYRCPIMVNDLANALVEMADTTHQGPLHVAGADRLSRYEFGGLIARQHGADPSRLVASTVAASGTTRPRDCSLDIARASSILRTRLRGAREVLAGWGNVS